MTVNFGYIISILVIIDTKILPCTSHSFGEIVFSLFGRLFLISSPVKTREGDRVELTIP